MASNPRCKSLPVQSANPRGKVLRCLGLIAPQIAISLLAAGYYAHCLAIYPFLYRLIPLHGLMVGAGLATGVVTLGLLARSAPWRDRPCLRRLTAVTIAAGGLGLNLFYLLQLGSCRLFFYPINTDSLATVVPHLRGVMSSGGPVAYALVLIAGGALAVLIGAWFQADRLWSLLLRATPETGWIRRHPRLFWTVTGGVAAGLLGGIVLRQTGRGGVTILALRYDPVAVVWTRPPVGYIPPPAAIAAESEVWRSYTPQGDPEKRRHIILIVVDSLRWDHLSTTGYARDTTPFLRELQEQGKLQPVTYATAAANESKYGIFALLGSRSPEGLTPHQFLLPHALQRHGYRTHVVASGDHSVYGNMGTYYGTGYDLFHDGLAPNEFTVNDDRNLLATLARLPEADDQPAFFFIHLMSAHALGVLQPESWRWTDDIAGRETYHYMSQPQRQRAIDLYDCGVLQADLHLQRIFALLTEKHYLDDAIVVITSDHGEALGEGGVFGHRRTLSEFEIRIPMYFIDTRDGNLGPLPFANQVDVAPTLLDLIGAPAPATWQGHSILTTTSPASEPRHAFLTNIDQSGWRGVIEQTADRRLKYLFKPESAGLPVERAFDLLHDPGEGQDIANLIPLPERHRLRQLAADHFGFPLNP